MSCQFSKDGSKERSVFGRKIVYYRVCTRVGCVSVRVKWPHTLLQINSITRSSGRLCAVLYVLQQQHSVGRAGSQPKHSLFIAAESHLCQKRNISRLGRNRANLTEWKKRDRSELFYLIGAVVLAVAGSGRRCRFLRRMCYVSQPNTNGIGP